VLTENLDDDTLLSQTYAWDDGWPLWRFSAVKPVGRKVFLQVDTQPQFDLVWQKLIGWDLPASVLSCLLQFVTRVQAKWCDDLPLTLFKSTFNYGSVGELWNRLEDVLDGGDEMLGAYWESRHPENRRLVQPFHPSWDATEYARATLGDRLTEWEKSVRRGLGLNYSPDEITNAVIQVWQVRNGG